MPVRLLISIAWHHLLGPRRHLDECQDRCADACPVHEFHVALAKPVLASEIEAARREEERFKALAKGDFSYLEGAGHEAGQAAH